MEVTMEIPELIRDLEECTCRSCCLTETTPSRTLNSLFALTENEQDIENRKALVQQENGKLVRILFDFIRTCKPGSREQAVSLLILNNISLPRENKRFIALECGGAMLLADLLFKQPSNYLLVIIMINLVLADGDLREEVFDSDFGADFVGSIAHALKSALCIQNAYSQNSEEEMQESQVPSNELSSEIARWCHLALKNVTRSQLPIIELETHALEELVPFLLHLVEVEDIDLENLDQEVAIIHPPTWNSDSIQDAALFVLLNCCSLVSLREYMIEAGAAQVLFNITCYAPQVGDDDRLHDFLSSEQQRTLKFQQLKARMALSFLVGSVGHFGQPPSPDPGLVFISSKTGKPVILTTESETEELVELFDNVLHGRAKLGHGGYNATSFSMGCVSHALRCLLTHSMNRDMFARKGGVRLNVLLMKALALYSIKCDPLIEQDTASDICFSLYLLSNFGFKSCYLPADFGGGDRQKKIAAKILSRYIKSEKDESVGKHAAQQIMRRLPWLVFEGSVMDLTTLRWTDCKFGSGEMAAMETLSESVELQETKPMDDIFCRPVLRTPVPSTGSADTLWDSAAGSSVRSFSCVLDAVPSFSFGSVCIRHSGEIDDIQIANNIARCANGEKTECYGYLWTWQDTAEEIKEKLMRSQDPFLPL